METFEYSIGKQNFPDELQCVVDYFEDTWIGRPYRNNRRRASLLKHELWNCFEGWHNSFEHQLSACHPSIWKLSNMWEVLVQLLAEKLL